MTQDIFGKHMQAGEVAAAQGAWPDAARHFDQAVHAKPDAAAAHRNLAVALQSMGRLEEAEAVCRRSIALEPAAVAGHFNLGCLLLARQDFAGADAGFREALAREPKHARASFNLGGLAQLRGDQSAADGFYKRTLQADPTHSKAAFYVMESLVRCGRCEEAAVLGQSVLARLAVTPFDVRRPIILQMAEAHKTGGDFLRAQACYYEVIAAEPGNNFARHLLAAAEGRLTHTYARDYAATEFDNLASSFESHLLGALNYRSPEILADGLWRLNPDPSSFADVLDLGCGTGLVGAALAPHYRMASLAGVDLSGNMLVLAQGKGVYSALHKADILAYMAAAALADLITAADVFIYVGDLSAVFAAVARILKPGGIFAFSVELSPAAEVELSVTGRYRHSIDHIRRLADAHALRELHVENGPIRKEGIQVVDGLYIYLTG